MSEKTSNNIISSLYSSEYAIIKPGEIKIINTSFEIIGGISILSVKSDQKRLIKEGLWILDYIINEKLSIICTNLNLNKFIEYQTIKNRDPMNNYYINEMNSITVKPGDKIGEIILKQIAV